jgi:hypothetical protein
MDLHDEFLERGFSDLKFDWSPPRIFGNHESGVGFYFYSKHSIATLTIYDALWRWHHMASSGAVDSIELSEVWDYMSGDPIEHCEYDLSGYKGGDMGALIDDEMLLKVFDTMWKEYEDSANDDSN